MILFIFSFFFRMNLLALAQIQSQQPVQMKLTVSPQGDGSSCTARRPCSLETALKTISNETHLTSVQILLRKGVYRLVAPVVLDLSQIDPDIESLTIESEANDKAILSGGTEIKNWSLFDRRRNIYRARLEANVSFRNLFVADQRAVRAKSEDHQLLFTADANGYIHSYPEITAWKHPSDLEVVHLFTFKSYRCGVQEVLAGSLVMKQPCWRNSRLTGLRGDATWIENAFELLDKPGEWYFDQSEGWIYFVASNANLKPDFTARFPQLEELLVISGKSSNSKLKVRLRGLTFSDTDFKQPMTTIGYSPVQADFTLVGQNETPATADYSVDWKPLPAAVRVQGARNIEFRDCLFKHLGATALEFDDGSQDNLVQGSVFQDVSGSAIRIGNIREPRPNLDRSNARIRVSENRIFDVAVEFLGSVGIWAGYAKQIEIDQNEISELPYTGISLGWGWGIPDPTDSERNWVHGNEIHHVMKRLVDGGAIYTLGDQPGTRIENNYIHDVGRAVPDPTFGPYRGLYLDQGSRNIEVRRNVLEDSIAWLSISNPGNTFRSNYHEDRFSLGISEEQLNQMGNYWIPERNWPIDAVQIIRASGLRHPSNPTRKNISAPPSVP